MLAAMPRSPAVMTLFCNASLSVQTKVVKRRMAVVNEAHRALSQVKIIEAQLRCMLDNKLNASECNAAPINED